MRYYKRQTTYGNRGMSLEMFVINANNTYQAREIALITKVPTPVNVLRAEGGRVRDGFYEDKSIVDFVGNYKGKHIAFDAKSTKNKTSFPLKNIDHHQYEYLRLNHEQNGISFLVIEFVSHREIYILKFEDLEKWWTAAKKGGPKSIKYSWFTENCSKCGAGRGIPLDYLNSIDNKVG